MISLTDYSQSYVSNICQHMCVRDTERDGETDRESRETDRQREQRDRQTQTENQRKCQKLFCMNQQKLQDNFINPTGNYIACHEM